MHIVHTHPRTATWYTHTLERTHEWTHVSVRSWAEQTAPDPLQPLKINTHTHTHTHKVHQKADSHS